MVTRKDIEQLIVENKISNLKTHFKDMLFYNTVKYSGEIRSDEILLWRSSYFLRGAYPIFHIKFDKQNRLNNIKKEKNPFHIVLNKISLILFISTIIGFFVTSDIKFALIATIGISVVAFLLNMVLTKGRNYEMQLITDELKEVIENIEFEKNPELVRKSSSNATNKTNEWSLKKILTRLILYPFCAFIVYLSLIHIIPEGKRELGIFGVLIGLGYPIVDLIIAFGRKNYS